MRKTEFLTAEFECKHVLTAVAFSTFSLKSYLSFSRVQARQGGCPCLEVFFGIFLPLSSLFSAASPHSFIIYPSFYYHSLKLDGDQDDDDGNEDGDMHTVVKNPIIEKITLLLYYTSHR